MNNQQNIGFIGLGVMGEPMCRNLSTKSGLTFTAFDRREEPLTRLAQVGVGRAVSLAEMAASDVVFLSLPDGEAVRDVCLGNTGLITMLNAGAIVVDLGTSPVALARELDHRFRGQDVLFSDAPVARTRAAAEAGTLSIMVGADPAVFEALEPLLKMMGEEVTHCGGVGSGQLVKIMNNMVLFQTVSAVVLATGGFQANPEMRTRYLGPRWELAKVRGSRFNTGAGIRMALDIGAAPRGNWSGCHAVAWDLNAPEFGDLAVGDMFQKHSYPFSLVVNNEGERFLDEGADFRNYTYAKYGGRILEQPGQTAWQIFDAKVTHLMRDEYRIRQITRVAADSLEELADRLSEEHSMNRETFLRTITDFNTAVRLDIPFDPTVKDGRRTDGLLINKMNWATTLDTPPYEAFGVTCGITFTFGGLRITPQAQVVDEDLIPIPGLFAAGELVGGIFYHNYPGGTGLLNGAVFGRIAGNNAATA